MGLGVKRTPIGFFYKKGFFPPPEGINPLLYPKPPLLGPLFQIRVGKEKFPFGKKRKGKKKEKIPLIPPPPPKKKKTDFQRGEKQNLWGKKIHLSPSPF